MTLDKLIATPIAGNAYHDGHIFMKVDAFVLNDANSLKDKVDALEWMETKVMGCESTYGPDKEFPTRREYIQSYVGGI